MFKGLLCFKSPFPGFIPYPHHTYVDPVILKTLNLILKNEASDVCLEFASLFVKILGTEEIEEMQ